MNTSVSIALSALLFVAVPVLTAQVSVPYQDNFDYDDGDLAGQGLWTTTGGSRNPIQVESGSIILDHGSRNRQDMALALDPQSTGVLNVKFDISVSASQSIGGGDYEYFAHFENDSGGDRGRLDVVNSANGNGDFSFGISTRSGTAEAVVNADLTFDTTYTVTLSFDFESGIASVAVQDTLTGQDLGSADGTRVSNNQTLAGLALRQSNSSRDETITVDNLSISVSVPEPSAIAFLGGLMGLGLMSVRRRR